jgi:RND family efflux transporter MFP subunit
VILAGGVAFAMVMVKTRPEPQREEEEATLPVVDTILVSSGKQSVKLQLNGQVQPSKQLVVLPEVSGRITWQNKQLVLGGIIKKGEPLVHIDARDYSLAVKQQEAQLSSQELSLKVEEGRRKIAEQEWEMFKKEREAAGLPPLPDDEQSLVLRQPYQKSAEVGVSSARSSLSRAELALSKTTIMAPFNAFVRAEAVEQGQLVSPGMQLATLVGTDAFWIQVSVPIDKLSFVKVPKGDQPGSKVRVFLETGNGRVESEGWVIRLLGDLDPVGRLARVLVEIQDPFHLKANHNDDVLPILLGSYVHVEIEGVELDDVLKIPRTALQENSKVYRLDAEDKLEILDVDIAWGTREFAMVRGPLAKGDRLVVTTLAAPVAGMKVRVAEPKSAAAETAADNGGAK